MKRTLTTIALLGLLAAVAFGAMTHSATSIIQRPDRISSGSRYDNPVYLFCNEIEGYAEGGSAWPTTVGAVELVTANDVLTAAESGTTYVVDGNTANVVLTLPTAAAGTYFTFVDANSTAASDLYVKSGAADTINGGTAAQYFASKGDATAWPQTVTLLAVDATRWLSVDIAGTWAADDAPD